MKIPSQIDFQDDMGGSFGAVSTKKLQKFINE